MIKLGSNFWALDAEPTSCSHTDTTHYWSVSSTYLPCLTNNSLCSDEEVLHHHQDHRPHPDEVVPPQVLHHDLHFLLFLLNDDPTLRTAWTVLSYDYNLGWLTLFSTHIVISTRTYPLTLPQWKHCPQAEEGAHHGGPAERWLHCRQGLKSIEWSWSNDDNNGITIWLQWKYPGCLIWSITCDWLNI